MVFSLNSDSASRLVSTVTSTLEWSGVTAMPVTVPISTSLNLRWDCPTCRPSAVSNEMVIVGPRLDMVSQASHAAIRAEKIGTSQTSGSLRRRRTPAVATLPDLGVAFMVR